MDVTVVDHLASAKTEGRASTPPLPTATRWADAAPLAAARVRVDGKFFARGASRLHLRGVAYGPFAANSNAEPFPTAQRVREDFSAMRAAQINALRIYHLPPDWLLRLADEQGMALLVDVPWPKHLCFLDSSAALQGARQHARQAASRGRHHPCLFAYSIGNEIPPDIVRWHGTRRVERFLAELCDVVKQADPDGLVTYANYPPTEYLDVSFLDFATFNVYLHDLETFRRYLFRLHNIVGERPLLLGELGMDTIRQGEMAQADFLKSHLREAAVMGLAGAFVFSWTDEWHTGGHAVRDWAFGITYADRVPKPAYHALRELFEQAPAQLLPALPRVSVIVCSYNGGATLEQCLRSLSELDYPDYEVIVVDDGSTDDTRVILQRLRMGDRATGERRGVSPPCGPQRADAAPLAGLGASPLITVIHQPNRGLSVARNVGLRAASGKVIAYTDSDCFADRQWLTHLVEQLERSGAAGVGGPNLTPEDGWLAACVAASPGQPTHVLESDQVAEHIPGCNMAYRREALEAINGFDPQYKKAGDDVDLCWRLQQAGYWITYAPGAFVWHHRRQTPRAYLRQQAGYGEAEALLRFKHPDKFNGLGDGKWRGVLYGSSLRGLRMDDAIIYRGTFGTGLFQCIYQPGPAHWAMLPTTLEWHLVAGLVGLAAFVWPLLWFAAFAMLALSAFVALLQAAQARLAKRHQGFRSRLLVAALCYAQPLVRSWQRYCTRLFGYRVPTVSPAMPVDRGQRLPWWGRQTVDYWSEEGYDRTELLGLVIAYLNEHGWGKTVDSGWQDWDVEIHCHPWTVVQVSTVQEEHGGGRRLIRVRYRLRPSGHTRLLALAALVCFVLWGLAGMFQEWLPAISGGLLISICLGVWLKGTWRAAGVVSLVENLAQQLQMVRMGERRGVSPP